MEVLMLMACLCLDFVQGCFVVGNVVFGYSYFDYSCFVVMDCSNQYLVDYIVYVFSIRIRFDDIYYHYYW